MKRAQLSAFIVILILGLIVLVGIKLLNDADEVVESQEARVAINDSKNALIAHRDGAEKIIDLKERMGDE